MLSLNGLKKLVLGGSILGAAVLAVPTIASAQDDANWDIKISYDTEASEPVVGKSGLTYQQAYDAIPFNRAEYDANPSYRHDAAMELMFGEMRPTTIIRNTSPQASKYPTFNRPDLQWSQLVNFRRSRFYYGPWYYPY